MASGTSSTPLLETFVAVVLLEAGAPADVSAGVAAVAPEVEAIFFSDSTAPKK